MTTGYAIGVIFHQRGEQAEEELAAFVEDLRGRGVTVGGLYQRTVDGRHGHNRMELVDIRTGRVYSITQNLGRESSSCSLDTSGLADASQVLRRDIDDRVDVLVISKFAGQEALGHGFMPELSAAVSAGIPVLTSVSARYREAWDRLTGDVATVLAPDRDSLEAWWAAQSGKEIQ